MLHAYFERINRTQNAYRFYRYVILVADDRSQCSLRTEWGRIGRRPRTSEIGRGPIDILWGRVAALSRVRLVRGYRLVSFEGPPKTRVAIVRQTQTLGAPGCDRTDDTGLFFVLPKLEALFGECGASPEAQSRLNALRDLLDPGPKRRCAAVHHAQQLELPGLSRRDDAEDHLRALTGLLANVLLRREPRMRAAVGRTLATPRQIEGDNVAHIVQISGALDMPLLQMFHHWPNLVQVAHRLSDDGVLRMREFVTLPVHKLRDRYHLTTDDLCVADRLCGQYGLQLGMTQVIEPALTAPRAALR